MTTSGISQLARVYELAKLNLVTSCYVMLGGTLLNCNYQKPNDLLDLGEAIS